jgi:hypothetical protein
LSALVVLLAGGYALYKEWPGIKHEVNGYSFAETLSKTTDAAGGDARVLTFLVRGEDFSYQVVTRHGDVLERFYGELCNGSSRGNHNCTVRESRHQHPASAKETERAQVRLADISPSILGQLRHDSGAGDIDAIGLRRRQWVIAKPEQPYIADADGSNLHRATTPGELALAKSVAEAPDTR